MKILPNDIAILEWDTHISKWVIETGKIDHDETIELYLLPLINKGDWVVDCGANIGSHTVPYAKKVGANGKVYGFEVSQHAMACLTHNTKHIPWVEVRQVGLSDRFERPMFCPNENVGAGFLKPGIFTPEIECIPLDSLELERLNYFKIDCEGYELFVLRGAWKTIQRCKPIMFIEVNAAALDRNKVKASDIKDFLDLLGYEYAPHGDCEEQYDLICKPMAPESEI